MTLADDKRTARARLHERLALPFRVYTEGETDSFSEVSARLFKSPELVGDVQGGGVGLAQVRDLRPRLVFLRSEHEPRRGNVYVLVTEGESTRDDVYRVETLDPPDGITITAYCVWLSKTQVDPYFQD